MSLGDQSRGGLSGQLHPERQRVDEHSHRALGPGTALQAARDNSAEYHIFARRAACQHHCPGSVQDGGRQHAPAAGLDAQLSEQRFIQLNAVVLEVTAVNLHIQHIEWCCGTVHVGQKAAEVGLMRLDRAGQGLCHEVTIGLWFRQVRAFAAHDGLNFIEHDHQANVVVDDMVIQQRQQPASGICIVGQIRSNQRCLAQVDTMLCRVCYSIQLQANVIGPVELQGIDCQTSLALHHLHWLWQSAPVH